MLNSRIKKIIFIIDAHFCARDYTRYGIDLLKSNGFDVLVWEVTPIINLYIYNNVIVPDPVKYTGHRVFYNMRDIQNNIMDLESDCFIVLFGSYCSGWYRILRSMSRKNIPYCFDISGGSYPRSNDYTENSCKANIMKMTIFKVINKIKISKSKYKLIREQIYKRIPYGLLFLKPADFVIEGGIKSNIHLYRLPIGPKTKLLPIHYHDYDNYLAEMEKNSNFDQTTGVFLDGYAPFHPDYLLNGAGPPIKAEEYYPYIRKFFDYLEETFQVKIIIAAHPRSHYGKNSDYFGGRPVVRDKTCELVRRAGFVLAQPSYSINYAVLFNKPILFLTSDAYDKRIEGSYIQLMAAILGKKPIFMDKPFTFDWETELLVDTVRYHEYKQNHIKINGTEELPFWQVFADYIKSSYRS